MGLNKQQLTAKVAGGTGLTKVQAEKAIKSTLAAINDELSAGGSVTLIGFGTFSVMGRKARSGKNPRTGASIKIPAKKVPKFKPGKALKDAVASPKAAKKVAKKK